MKSGITNASCRRKISYQSNQSKIRGRQKKRDKKAKEKNEKKSAAQQRAVVTGQYDTWFEYKQRGVKKAEAEAT